MTDLARRAVACKGWRWMEPMRYKYRGNLYRVGAHTRVDAECLPDFDDPATIGCLESIVLTAFGGASFYAFADSNHGPDAGDWKILNVYGGTIHCGQWEGEGAPMKAIALVAALRVAEKQGRFDRAGEVGR